MQTLRQVPEGSALLFVDTLISLNHNIGMHKQSVCVKNQGHSEREEKTEEEINIVSKESHNI